MGETLFHKYSHAPESTLTALDARMSDIQASAMARELMKLPPGLAYPVVVGLEKASFLGPKTLRALSRRKGRQAYQAARTVGAGRRASLGAARLGGQEAAAAGKLNRLQRKLRAMETEAAMLQQSQKAGLADKGLQARLKRYEKIKSKATTQQKDLQRIQDQRRPFRPPTPEEQAVIDARAQVLEQGGVPAAMLQGREALQKHKVPLTVAGTAGLGFAGAQALQPSEPDYSSYYGY